MKWCLFSREAEPNSKIIPVPPSSLEISPSGSVEVKAGRLRQVSCTARGATPKARIVWYHRGQKILDQGKKMVIMLKKDMLEGGPAVALSEYKPVANSCGLMWLQTLKYIGNTLEWL